MDSTGVGYAWTFAFLLVAFTVVAISWAAIASSRFQHNAFLAVLLTGTIAVIIRTMYNVVLYDRLSQALKNTSKTSNPYAQTVTTTCPEDHKLVVDDNTGNLVCENTYNKVRIGVSEIDTIDLTKVDVTKECALIASNAHDRPWVAMRKYCEYTNRL
jgi:hypothetical protein